MPTIKDKLDTVNTSVQSVLSKLADVDITTAPSTIVTATNLDVRDLTSVSDSVEAVLTDGTDTVAINASGRVEVDIEESTLDLALGTDISNVIGTASLILATGADDLVNTTDALVTAGLGYVFDGTTWDRVRGDSTDGLLVNLGTNNDVVVSASNLDVRDLASATDSVTAVITDGVETVAINTSNRMEVDLEETGLDLALGTDISAVLGTASLVLSAGADDVVNTTDMLATAAFGYVFDGATWDRMPGTSAAGVTVNIGSGGTVAANAGTNLNTSALALEATLGDVKTELVTLNASETGFTRASGTITDNTPTEIIAAVGGDYARIKKLSIQMADASPTAVTITLKSAAVTMWIFYLPATDGWLDSETFEAPLDMGTNESVTLTSSGTTTFVWNVQYKMV
mgnify:CR=1 FL=1